MSSRARPSRLAALTLLVITVGIAPAASAEGGQLLIDVPGDGKGFVHDTDSPLLRITELAPGYTTSGTLALRNDSSGRADLTLRALDVDESENGCVRPEQNDGDVTCTDDGGELADWLEVEVGEVTHPGPDRSGRAPSPSSVDRAPGSRSRASGPERCCPCA